MSKLVLKSAALLTAALILTPALAQTVKADTAASYDSTGQVTFTPNTDVTGPVDPSDPTLPYQPTDPNSPDGKPQPGTAGPLSIDYASSFDFGTHPVGTTGIVYAASQKGTDSSGAAATRDNYVQVTDKRGSFAGWSLSVTQGAQFATASGDQLVGAALNLGKGAIQGKATSLPADVSATSTTLTPGAASGTILGATAGHGVGTSLLNFGSADGMSNSDTSVALDLGTIVNASNQKAQAYTANLTWTLADTPANA